MMSGLSIIYLIVFYSILSEEALHEKIYQQKYSIADKIESDNSDESKNKIKMVLVIDLHPQL